jgi:hypothetical protein
MPIPLEHRLRVLALQAIAKPSSLFCAAFCVDC